MKFIDKTIKYFLLAIGADVSGMILVQILLLDCKVDGLPYYGCQKPPGWFALFGIILALLVGTLFTYLLVRVIFWPHGPKGKVGYRIAWIIGGIFGCFIALLTFGAFSLGAYGLW